MNIYNSYTDSETTVSAACERTSDDFYVTIPEEGRSYDIETDNIINYLPTKHDIRLYRKVLNKFEDINDSDVSTDIDSENEIIDLPEPCDTVNNNTSGHNSGARSSWENYNGSSSQQNNSSSRGNNNKRSSGGAGDGDKNNNKGDKVDDKRDGSYSEKKGTTKDKYHDKHIPFLSRFVGKKPRDNYPAQERYTPPFYAKISAAAGARGGVSAVSMPSGGAGTKSRDLKNIYNKQSVIRIKNEDNNCFWYALAIATMSGDNRNIKTRESALVKAGKFLCNKFNYIWDTQVSFDQIIEIEEQYKGLNIYVLDVNNLPLLNTTIHLATALLYKSEYSEDNIQCWLLYNNGHFDVITKIEAFLAVRHLCNRCLKTFLHKDDFTCHECLNADDSVKIKNTPKHKINFLKDAAHYLRRGYSLGSDQEIIDSVKYDF